MATPFISKHEYTIYSKDGNILYVVAAMHTIGYYWMDKIEYHGRTYKFRQNGIMKDWMIGKYSGCAEYELEKQCLLSL